jgi:probable F420-dependent oxidoreductase
MKGSSLRGARYRRIACFGPRGRSLKADGVRADIQRGRSLTKAWVEHKGPSGCIGNRCIRNGKDPNVLRSTKQEIRFGTGPGMGGPETIKEAARIAEKAGFSSIGMPDHFMIPVSPLIGLQAIADATTTIRLTTAVLDHDFRHPGVLAKDLATLDVLSGGRVEVGIGAGWLQAEYEQSGIPFDRASVRIERLEEYVTILKGLFADEPFSFEGKHFTIKEMRGSPTPIQRPRPPIMIGGGGPKILGVAARHADIVQITSSNRAGTFSFDRSQFTAEAFDERVALVRDAAGARLKEIELGTALMGFVVTDDRDSAVKNLLDQFGGMIRSAGASFELTTSDVIESPAFAIGTVEQIGEKLLELRDRYGLSYFTLGFGADPESAANVIQHVAGK